MARQQFHRLRRRNDQRRLPPHPGLQGTARIKKATDFPGLSLVRIMA
jgi:hypothetical protein